MVLENKRLDFNLEHFTETLSLLLKSNKLLVAYSGGIDSHVLLYSLASLRHQHPLWQLRAIHIHHGLHADADKWSLHCQQVCQDLGIPLIVKNILVSKKEKSGIEAAARKARYDAMTKILQPDECLLTAHHQDDQAETLLLQLFRGAGPMGLAGMPKVTNFGKGYHVRPLLTFTRDELYRFAKESALNWLEDPSNAEISFNRNYLRNRIFPELKSRWPHISAVISRSADNCAQANAVLEDIAAQDRGSVQHNNNALSVSGLLLLTQARRFNVLRYWMRGLNLPLPHRKNLEKIENEVLLADRDASPLVAWKGVEIRRYRDTLYAMPPLEKFDHSISFSWQVDKELKLPSNLGTLTSEELRKRNIMVPKNGVVSVRFRQGGEKIRFNDQPHSKDLKKLMQEKGIPPWERDRIPLLYENEKIIGIWWSKDKNGTDAK